MMRASAHLSLVSVALPFALLAACSGEASADEDCLAEIRAMHEELVAYADARMPQLTERAADGPPPLERQSEFAEFKTEIESRQNRIAIATQRCPAAAREALEMKQEAPVIDMSRLSDRTDGGAGQ